jgi:hypothetical protein
MPHLEKMRIWFAFAPQGVDTPPSSPGVLIQFLLPVVEFFIDLYVKQSRVVKFGIYIKPSDYAYDDFFDYLKISFLVRYQSKKSYCDYRLVRDGEKDMAVICVGLVSIYFIVCKNI